MSENELNEFMDFYTRRNLLLIAELQEVTSSGSKVLIGCPHHSHRQTIEPTIQIWQVSERFKETEVWDRKWSARFCTRLRVCVCRSLS